MKRLLLGATILMAMVSTSLGYPTTAIPMGLSYCMTQEIAIAGILERYPNATHIDAPTVIYFTTAEEPTTLAIYFNEQGCADAYEFVPRTSS